MDRRSAVLGAVVAVLASVALAVLHPLSDWMPRDGYPLTVGAVLNVLPLCMLPTVALIALLSRPNPPRFADDSGVEGDPVWPWHLVWRIAFVAATLLPTVGVAARDYEEAALVFGLVWLSFGSFMVLRLRRMDASAARGLPVDAEVERLAVRFEWFAMFAPLTGVVAYLAVHGELGSLPAALRYPLAMVVLSFAFANVFLHWPSRHVRAFTWMVLTVWYGGLALSRVLPPGAQLATAVVCVVPVPIAVEIVRRRELRRRLVNLSGPCRPAPLRDQPRR